MMDIVKENNRLGREDLDLWVRGKFIEKERERERERERREREKQTGRTTEGTKLLHYTTLPTY